MLACAAKLSNLLGGWCVSSTQYASVVSASTSPLYLICRCLDVRSSSGGRGKDCTFMGVFVDIFANFVKVVRAW